MRTRIIAALALMFAIPLTACATVKGAGRDIQSAGQCGEDVIHGGDC